MAAPHVNIAKAVQRLKKKLDQLSGWKNVMWKLRVIQRADDQFLFLSINSAVLNKEQAAMSVAACSVRLTTVVDFVCVSLSVSVSGDSLCGVCVFCCSVQTQVHCSHGDGVCDHYVAGVSLPVQTQQEADFLLLAFCCEWHFTAQMCHINIIF